MRSSSRRRSSGHSGTLPSARHDATIASKPVGSGSRVTRPSCPCRPDLIRSPPSWHAPARCRCGTALRRLTPSSRKGHAQVLYWWSKFVLVGPLLRLLLQADDRGCRARPGARWRDPRQQPPRRRRLVPPAAAGAAPHHLPRQARVLHPARVRRAAEEDLLHRGRAGAGRPVERVGRAGRAGHGRAASCARASCWASTRRAPARRTGGCTRARPAWPAWRWRPGVPVIPVAMIGTDRVNPIGSRMWRPHKVHIKIGEPLDFSRYHGMAGDRFIERSMTDEIMYALMELTGQTYVDMYAASVKDARRRAAGRPAAGEARELSGRSLCNRTVRRAMVEVCSPASSGPSLPAPDRSTGAAARRPAVVCASCSRGSCSARSPSWWSSGTTLWSVTLRLRGRVRPPPSSPGSTPVWLRRRRRRRSPLCPPRPRAGHRHHRDGGHAVRSPVRRPRAVAPPPRAGAAIGRRAASVVPPARTPLRRSCPIWRCAPSRCEPPSCAASSAPGSVAAPQTERRVDARPTDASRRDQSCRTRPPRRPVRRAG